MPILRCCSCMTEWEAAPVRGKGPECPSCKAGPLAVAQVEVIHFDPPSATPGRGLNHAACNPKLRPGPTNRFTGEHDAVTCRACRETEIYKTAGPAGCMVLAVGKLPA